MIKSCYIHIPFCSSICSYCDFCKFLSNDLWINKYLEGLNNEINSYYKGDVLNTLYIGGGTPSMLNIQQLSNLFIVLKKLHLNDENEFTFECNINDITPKKLKILKENGVNRLSIGVQSFNDKNLKYLNRNHTKKEILKNISLAKKYFDNINIDLIYAIPGETIKELEDDIDEFIKLGINHISTYSLMIEPNTKLYINHVNSIDDDIDYEMYELISNKLIEYGYNHYEISNFSKEGFQSKHNLTYWNNNEYYGFGLGASGYVNGLRYENTRNFNKYVSGDYINEFHNLDKVEQIENEFILGLRKINGINKIEFFNKYNLKIDDIESVKDLLKSKKLLENGEYIYINPKYIYTSNDILLKFIS